MSEDTERGKILPFRPKPVKAASPEEFDWKAWWDELHQTERIQLLTERH